MASLKNTTINDTGYLTIPSGTILQRPAAPSAGMFRYNSDYKLNEFYNGTGWTTSTGENSIVQSGLVLWLDAGLQSSYPGSGTTWTDLSGNNNNVTLTNGPTYSSANQGSIVFDGVDDYADFFAPSLGTTTTVEMWVKLGSGYAEKMFFGWASYDVYCYSGGIGYNTGNSDMYGISSATVSSLGAVNNWKHYVFEMRSDVSYTNNKIYINNSLQTLSQQVGSENAATRTFNSGSGRISGWRITSGYHIPMNCASFRVYNRALTAPEIQQNYFALKNRFRVIDYETLTYTTSANLTVTGNGTSSVNIFKTSGSNSWDNQAYSTTGFTAPCTIEFNKEAASTDNGASYAMMSWNEDPTANASYDTLDHASYPYATSNYQVYSNGTLVLNSGTWSTANKFYVVYTTDGLIRHYNGSTLLYTSSSYGIGKTVYVDSSFYSVNATYGGFSNIRVCRFAWNGTEYI